MSNDIFISTPLKSLAVYQILARKHNLEICNMSIETVIGEDGYRFSFKLKGSSFDKKRYTEDMNILEWYEDRINDSVEE